VGGEGVHVRACCVWGGGGRGGVSLVLLPVPHGAGVRVRARWAGGRGGVSHVLLPVLHAPAEESHIVM